MNKHNIEKFDEEFIKKVLKSEEGISLDFKQKVSSKEKIARTISALANTKGGIIVVGISDQKKITGIDPNEEMYMIQDANDKFCIPPANIDFEAIKWIDEAPAYNEPSEKFILKAMIHPSKQEIKSPDKNGILKVYRRVNDQSTSTI